MSKITCIQCGSINSEYDYECSSCGTDLPLLSTAGTFSQEETHKSLTLVTDRHPAPSEAKKDMLGHFEILETIGQGGMGTVYKGRDLQLDRFVAIKVLRQKGGSKSEWSHLLKEARTASSLNHPNIITIHDVSRDNETDFMVMEWVDGQSLESKIPEGGLAPESIYDYALRIADGLARAHQAGIIHRDIKGANIMITEGDAVKILDFGLAKRMPGPDTPPDPEQTRQGTLKGTFSYMSPEQTYGIGLDARSDIFSFGVLLYYMISGKMPFPQRQVKALLSAIRTEEPPSLTKLKPDLDPALGSLVHRCLAKHCQDRPQSMTEVIAELERQQVKDIPKQPGFRSVKAIALTMTVLLAFTLSWFLLLPKGQTAEKVAILPFENLSGDPQLQVFCNGLASDLSNRFAGLESYRPGTWIVPVNETSRLENKSAKYLFDAYGVQRIISGRIEHQGRTRLLTLTCQDAEGARLLASASMKLPEDQLFDARNQILEKVLELLEWDLSSSARKVLIRGEPRVSGAYRFYLEGLSHLYRIDQRDGLQRALEAFEKALQIDPDYLDAMIGSAEACRKLWSARNNMDWLTRAESILNQANRVYPNHPEVKVAEGFLKLERGAFEEAEAALRPIWSDFPGHPRAGRGLALALIGLKKTNEVENVYRQTLTKRPHDWQLHSELATFFHNAGHYAQAEEAVGKVIELVPNNMIGYYSLASTLLQLGRPKEALINLDKALDLRDTGDPSTVAYALTNKGATLFSQRRFDEAVPAFEEAIALHPTSIINLRNLADSYRWSSGKKELAEPAYNKALALVRVKQQLRPNSDGLRAMAALCLAKTGRLDESLAEIHDAPLPRKPYEIIKWATAAELAHKRTLALEYLIAALEANFPYSELLADPEFDDLREDPDFEKMIGHYKLK